MLLTEQNLSRQMHGVDAGSGWEVFSLDYQIDMPVSLVITPEVREAFHQLLNPAGFNLSPPPLGHEHVSHVVQLPVAHPAHAPFTGLSVEEAHCLFSKTELQQTVLS